jgi:hypothetical protein
MLLPDKKVINWGVLVVITIISTAISLYAYFQIINIPPPVYVSVTRPYPKTIFINSPKTNKIIENPVLISGKAKVSEGILTIIIRDSKENILQKTTINNMKSNTPLPFSLILPYIKPNTKMGTIEASEVLPHDEEIGKTAIPIIFPN